MPFDTFLNLHGTNYSVFRFGSKIGTQKGLFNESPLCICFPTGTDINVGDILINQHGDRFHVTDKRTEGKIGVSECLHAFCKTEQEFNDNSRKTEPINFTINNNGEISGSVIGVGNRASVHYNEALEEMRRLAADDPSDTEAVTEIISLLQRIADGEEPPRKGMLAKFSDSMQSHSWIIAPLMSFFLSWLQHP